MMTKKEQELQDKLTSVPQAEWVRKMKEHYARTGGYRPEDLRRLLGDPRLTVLATSQPSMARSSLVSRE